MILVYSICQKSEIKMIVLEFDVLGIMSHHQCWVLEAHRPARAEELRSELVPGTGRPS